MLDGNCVGVLRKLPFDITPLLPNSTAPVLLRPRMKLSMHGFKPLLVDMRIDLRGGNIGVAQHLLDDPQIGAVPEQMRRETVPEKMWINIFLQTGAARVLFYDLPDARCG